ncbi:hypothetical protein U0070_008949 [Myodes glareolus]|uniref:Uncharacterized protein n=1 Tax=Myodes glareolus TaxID=447135 RepID=A0AAW0JNL5_MYOGA
MSRKLCSSIHPLTFHPHTQVPMIGKTPHTFPSEPSDATEEATFRGGSQTWEHSEYLGYSETWEHSECLGYSETREHSEFLLGTAKAHLYLSLVQSSKFLFQVFH